MKKVPPSRFSPPHQTGLNLIPLIPLLACIYPLTSTSLQTPLLSCKRPMDLTEITESCHVKDWKMGKQIGAEGEREREEKTHPSQKILAEIQRQKSFPHFVADNRQQEERGRPVPTAQSFKTNETLCVSHVGRAQPRPVTCTTASTVSLPLAPAPCETELGHLSFSFALPPTQALLESECF